MKQTFYLTFGPFLQAAWLKQRDPKTPCGFPYRTSALPGQQSQRGG